MLTYKEAKRLGCANSMYSCPSYLISNLSSKNTENQQGNYNLSASYSNNYNYYIENNGILYSSLSINDHGIRPVIKVPK